jgi:hypothetical protein
LIFQRGLFNQTEFFGERGGAAEKLDCRVLFFEKIVFLDVLLWAFLQI